MRDERHKTKKVSVVVPNYNYKRFLKKRISSILRQEYPISELIVLDDASTDGSQAKIRELLQEVQRRLPNLKVKTDFRKKNSGKTIRQWRRGFELAEGDFVWIAEADDLARKGFLAEVMKGFEDPEVLLSYTESAIINGLGMVVVPDFRWSRDKEKTGHFDKSYIRDGEEEIREIMAVRCTIPNVSAAVFRKKQWMLQLLDEAAKFQQAGDWYFYAKVLERGKIAYNRKSLNCFRVHNGSATKGSNEGGKHYQEVVKMHRMLREGHQLSDEVLGWQREEEELIRKKHGIMDV